MHRPQFRLRELMIGVIGCALVAVALLRNEESGWLFFLAGPVCGSLVHRAKGGRGILGGTIGGGGSYLCIGVAIHAKAYFSSKPIVGDLLGPWLGLSLFTFRGATIGLIVGVLIWGIGLQIDDKDDRYPWHPPTTEPTKPPDPLGLAPLDTTRRDEQSTLTDLRVNES
jgi:hypothetical protein